VPEVTFSGQALEDPPGTAQAARMNQRLRALMAPLNFAALIAWLAIGWEMLLLGTRTTAWIGDEPPYALMACLHVAFLALFLAHVSDGWSKNVERALVLVQIAMAFALLSMSRSSSLPILMVLCVIQVVHVWPARSAIALIGLLNIGMYLIFDQLWQLRLPIVNTLMHLSFQAFAALTAWYAVSAERSRDELATVNADLLATRSLLAETARDSERLRLSRELHDVSGHKLTALKLNLAALARDDRSADRSRVVLCAQLADELLAEIRGVVQQMRAEEGLDLGAALSALASPYPRPRMHLQIESDARAGTLAQAETLLRTVQEALTNAARHGNAENFWVVLRREHDCISLDVRDDGRGTGTICYGNGLNGMRERIEAAGGSLAIERVATGGVHLRMSVPA